MVGILQALTLVAVGIYTVFTYFIMKSSVEQAEAAQKPCLALKTMARDPQGVVRATDAVGAMVLSQQGGNIVVANIGSGPALNVRYELRPVDETARASPGSYLQSIAAKGESVLAVAHKTLHSHKYSFSVSYESLSGRKYRTAIEINDCVPTESRFERLTH